MSLKSFDKFCERMITGERTDNKEVFDERQNQVRAKLTVEALFVYAGVSAFAVFINEETSWCEGMLALMAVCGALAFLWWTIRCAVKGCIFGVKGFSSIAAAWGMLAEMLIIILCVFLNDTDTKFITDNGQASISLLILIGCGILIIASLIVIAANCRHRKAVRASSDDN